MSEKEKMKAGHLYQSYDQELYREREICKRMLYEYNRYTPVQKEEKDVLLKKLLNCKGELWIEPPFIVSMVTILRLVLIFIVMLISPF